MPRKVNPPIRGVWKLVARAQRVGLSEGMRGKGSTWLAVGVGAWGLQRLRAMAVKEDEILLREPLGPGETLTIRHETTTRAEETKRRKDAERERKAAEKARKAAEKARKAAEKARKDRRRR
ncbi:MAG TPA: hypothetical protein VF228_08750 [Iamia sp.]